MKTNTLTVKFTHAQMRDSAMRAAGISPQVMSMKPGTRVNHRNRKVEARIGHGKHKARLWD